MKIQAILTLVAILAIFPLAADAQGYNINVNLNDAMVSQRNLEMAQRLNDANALATPSVKHHHWKLHKNKAERAVLLQKTNSETWTDATQTY